MLAAPTLAQEAKPKKDKKDKPAAEKKEKPAAEKKEKIPPKAENPFGEKSAEKSDQKKSDAKKADAEKKAVPDDPAVAAILETKPTTPAECFGAAKTLADLGRLDLAKDFLKKILDAKLDPQQQAELGEQFGVVTFLDMAERKELLPEAKQLADAVAAASKRSGKTPSISPA